MNINLKNKVMEAKMNNFDKMFYRHIGDKINCLKKEFNLSDLKKDKFYELTIQEEDDYNCSRPAKTSFIIYLVDVLIRIKKPIGKPFIVAQPLKGGRFKSYIIDESKYYIFELNPIEIDSWVGLKGVDIYEKRIKEFTNCRDFKK